MAEDTDRTREPMSAFEYLMFKGEHDPSSRSSMIAVYVLDGTPKWSDVRKIIDRASRGFVRLRQHVIEGVGEGWWVVDPGFDLNYHLRRQGVPAPGSVDDLLRIVEAMLMTPLDTARPLWETVLFEGLEGNRSALAMKSSHSLTDGIGGIRMNALIFDEERDAPERKVPPEPIADDVTSQQLRRQTVRQLPLNVLRGLGRVAGETARIGIGTARNPRQRLQDVSEYVQSARRTMAPPGEPSALLSGRSASRRVLWTQVQLDDLRRAAKAAGGSLNDAYLAALSGALGRYHERLGSPVETVPMAVPINVRPAHDEDVGGNYFAGASFAAPVGERDPAVRIRTISEVMKAARDEPALTIMNYIAPVLSRLPEGLTKTLTGGLPSPDVQASNVPGHREDVFFAGCKVDIALGFGPLPGCAMMMVLLSHGDTLFLSAHYDPAAITEPDVFEECLREGLDEVVALGRS
jgi:diacylglycerol O-acyltransferase / wax synthase